MCHVFFTHSSVDRHLVGFHILAVVNNINVNFCVAHKESSRGGIFSLLRVPCCDCGSPHTALSPLQFPYLFTLGFSLGAGGDGCPRLILLVWDSQSAEPHGQHLFQTEWWSDHEQEIHLPGWVAQGRQVGKGKWERLPQACQWPLSWWEAEFLGFCICCSSFCTFNQDTSTLSHTHRRQKREQDRGLNSNCVISLKSWQLNLQKRNKHFFLLQQQILGFRWLDTRWMQENSGFLGLSCGWVSASWSQDWLQIAIIRTRHEHDGWHPQS